jgi:crossover junction endodeoxyribonuclease RuvC
MTVILGIDPGSRKTGYGLIVSEGSHNTYLAHGCMHFRAGTLAERLQQIFAGISEIVQQYQPTEAAVEQIFVHTNPQSALKLGHARGAALVALNMPVSEYPARVVKQAITGYGAASKLQIQQMIKLFLKLSINIQEDAADALGVALCHAHSRVLAKKLAWLQQK